MKGRVIKSTGSWYEVVTDKAAFYSCRARGKLRLEGYKETNPIAVGDWVEFDVEDKLGNINAILPRRNQIVRQSVKKTGHSQVLAANIDQALLIATIVQPRTSLGFIDRFFATSEAYSIPQVLLINKSDLLKEEEMVLAKSYVQLYLTIGVKTMVTSLIHDENLASISHVLENKTTLIAGHSGTGKSTLINKLSPDIGQAVGKISDSSDKGVHTTTFAEMFRLNQNTFIIDTPGIKEWGLQDMVQQEISDYFPEMRDRRLNCRFGSKCLHINEPKCAIKVAVESGEIALTRYQSYLSMVEGEDNRK